MLEVGLAFLVGLVGGFGLGLCVLVASMDGWVLDLWCVGLWLCLLSGW